MNENKLVMEFYKEHKHFINNYIFKLDIIYVINHYANEYEYTEINDDIFNKLIDFIHDIYLKDEGNLTIDNIAEWTITKIVNGENIDKLRYLSKRDILISIYNTCIN